MQPLQTLNLDNQPIWLFDLGLSNTARSQRHVVLDTILAAFFTKNLTTIATDCRQFIEIVHTRGQPAQAVFLAKNGKKLTLNLAISYALPYVAVALNSQKIGLDLCVIADFDTMTIQEKQQFCHDYFVHLPVTTNNSTLAKHWSQLEALVKYHQITLAQAVENPLFLQHLKTLNIASEKILLRDKAFWLSVAIGY